LEKLPQFLVSAVNQKRNNEIFNINLSEIFEAKELYKQEQKSCIDNYLNNLSGVQSRYIKESEEFKIIYQENSRIVRRMIVIYFEYNLV